MVSIKTYFLSFQSYVIVQVLGAAELWVHGGTSIPKQWAKRKVLK